MPAVVASAPGRVNLIGEHTDYNGGLCLPFALSQRTTVRASMRTDRVLGLRSAQEDDAWEGTVEEQPEGWAAYVAGVVAVLRDEGYDIPGFDAVIDSDVPLGAGLSSSAALECATAVSATGLLGLGLDDALRHRLVTACVRAENDYVGAPTGGMDQTVAMLGRPGHALLLDFSDGSVTAVPLPLDEAELVLLVIDTRVSHALTEGSYGDRRTECSAAATELGVDALSEADLASVEALTDPLLRRRARHVLSENARVRDAVALIAATDWPGLGELLHDSHVSMRDDFEISCRELDLAVESARAAGALGARMTGGGFGGSAIALVPKTLVDDVRGAVTRAFSDADLKAPAYLTAVPGDAARLEGPS
jgi:galactokinase